MINQKSVAPKVAKLYNLDFLKFYYYFFYLLMNILLRGDRISPLRHSCPGHEWPQQRVLYHPHDPLGKFPRWEPVEYNLSLPG